MKNLKYILSVVAVSLCSWSCSEFLDPEPDNTQTEERIFENAAYFTGPLNEVYANIPAQFNTNMDKLTDNAVDQGLSGNYYICATGGLRPNSNPLDNWTNGYRYIRMINQFLEKMVLNDDGTTPVRWYPVESNGTDNSKNLAIFNRLKGEAYFLRAYWMADLLRNFGGPGPDGTMLGVPLVGDKVLYVDKDNLNIPRSTYDQCVKAITDDLDVAISLLPLIYNSTDAITGMTQNGRGSGIAAMALKARVLLYAASPAFNKPYDATKWEKAAIAAADAIVKLKNGAALRVPGTIDNYYFAQLNTIGATNFQNWDILFRGVVQGGNNGLETTNYPKGMYGSASTNVTQNFVDAFPDNAGYPITAAGTKYDAANPYANRDPRLAMYVAYNNTKMGPANYYTVESYMGGKDGINPSRLNSRTSYYLKKTLRPGTVRLIPGNAAATPRANVILGMPELYLNFAEAAAQAWGVKGDPKAYGFTAYSVLRAEQGRYTAAQGGVVPATYLDNVVGTDVAKFTTYLRNERRIELAFEGHYYYDLRRWIGDNSTATLNVDVYGMEITKTGTNTFTYQKKFLEKRQFTSPYQPIPYTEVFNAPAVVQNYGW